MSENDPASGLEIYWHHVPSHFSDGPIGASRAQGVHRIVMGELCYNTTPGAERPAASPVCNLLMTNESIRDFIKYLQSLDGVAVPDAGE